MDLMDRRRFLMTMQKPSEQWSYVLLAESDGRVEKAKIHVESGKHIHMEWNTDRLIAGSDTVLSLFQQINAFTENMNTVPNAVGGYPIIASSFHNDVYTGGQFDFDATTDLDLFIGYWRDIDTTDRRIRADYIKIRIT